MKQLLAIILLFFISPVFSQTQEALVPHLHSGKYGFSNSENNSIIKAKYDKALPFYEDYDLTIAVRNEKPVIINRKGKVILKSSTDYFQNDTIISVRLLPPENMERIAIREFCLQDRCPEFVIVSAFDRGSVFDKMNGLYFVSNQGKIFLIDKNGKKKSQYYDKIKHFDYGEIEYCITEDHLNQKEGLLDENGVVLLECVYDNITYKGKGVFGIKQGSIERDFKVETKPYSANIKNNQLNGNYKIRRKNGKSGVVDDNGKLVVTHNYDKLYPLNEDKFIFWKENKVGILDVNENYLFANELPFSFSERSNHKNFVPYTVFNKSYVFFNINDQWQLINLQGKQTENNYDGVFIDFQNVVKGIAGIILKNKVGIIDKEGKIILEPVFDKIYCLNEDDSFLVKTKEKWKWLDFNGETIYEDFDDFGYQLKNHLLVLQNGKWFYVGNNGNVFKD